VQFLETEPLNPTYRIRVSQKARHVRFQVTPERGLEVIIPRHFDPAKIPALLLKNSRWIERAIAKIKFSQEHNRSHSRWQVPTIIHFQAVNQQWSVVAEKSIGPSIRAVEMPGRVLNLRGAIDSELLCRNVLSQWLTRRGIEYLAPWLERVSQETGLRYTSVCIKQQKTRWGSCSHRKAINLNARLLFLPSNVVHYILVHELCHVRQLNHSARFWRLVESYLPNYQQVDHELKNANRFLPHWLF
jgi:predicted metal-dependent hydrolase